MKCKQCKYTGFFSHTGHLTGDITENNKCKRPEDINIQNIVTNGMIDLTICLNCGQTVGEWPAK